MIDPSALFRVRSAALSDLAALATLEARAFADPWTMEQFAGLWAGPGACAWLAEAGGEVAVGFALFRRVADEAELLRVATDPAWRRRQVASTLLRRALTELDGAAISTHLEVRADNLPAQALYRRLGFELSGSRRKYYRDDGDARIYVRKAGG